MNSNGLVIKPKQKQIIKYYAFQANATKKQTKIYIGSLSFKTQL